MYTLRSHQHGAPTADPNPLPVPLDHIHEVVCVDTSLSNRDVRIVNPVLAQDGLDLVVIDVCERDGVGDVDAALVLLAHGDIWGLLVEPNTETLELGLNDRLVAEGLEDIEYDEDEVACPCDCRMRRSVKNFGADARVRRTGNDWKCVSQLSDGDEF